MIGSPKVHPGRQAAVARHQLGAEAFAFAVGHLPHVPAGVAAAVLCRRHPDALCRVSGAKGVKPPLEQNQKDCNSEISGSSPLKCRVMRRSQRGQHGQHLKRADEAACASSWLVGASGPLSIASIHSIASALLLALSLYSVRPCFSPGMNLSMISWLVLCARSSTVETCQRSMTASSSWLAGLLL